MNHHGKLKLRLERHGYKRGAHKGEAPMGRRGMTHYRVIDNSTAPDPHMAVRFWNTDILKAYPDGTVVIDCDGYAGRPTTKARLNRSLPANVFVSSYAVMSQSQLILRTPKGRFRYFDGIMIDADGELISDPEPFLAKRIDKYEVEELNRDMEESGFKDMFKVLWGAAKPEDAIGHLKWKYEPVSKRPNLIAYPNENAEHWQSMVSYHAHITDFRTAQLHIKQDASTTWKNLMSWLKAGMYKITETEVYRLDNF